MPGIKLEAFQGIIPRMSDRLLPDMSATIARNTKLLNGEIRGYRAPREEADLSSVSPLRRAYRVKDSPGGYAYTDGWLAFNDINVDVVRSPLKNDAYDRYYWAGDGTPKMNTADRILNGDPEYLLGIPTPVTAPTVVPPAGSAETRAYVYTFVSGFGEEGPPSPPTIVTGDTGTWNLSNIDDSVPNQASRNITNVRIYRTVSGGTSTNFYFVAEIAFGVTVYADTQATNDVAQNNLLESTTFLEPPTDLEGLVAMPNGSLIGWSGRRLVMSEPYRPHAWPAEYELGTEFPIVGCVIWGSTLIVGTESQPYLGQGVQPGAFTLQKIDAVEPCLSKRGMVATVAGAYYPSINGLVLVNSSGVRVITQDLVTKEEWAEYNPSAMFAAQLGLQYIAFNSTNFGFIFNPTEQTAKFIEFDAFTDVTGIETDRYTGDVLLLSGGRVWNWDPATAERVNWQWQSKIYQFPRPVNFGAFRVQFATGEEDLTLDAEAFYGVYNSSLFAAVTAAEPAIDPYFANVVLLLNWNGADAATDTEDLSNSNHQPTFVGDAQIDTGLQIVGENTLLLDGTGDRVDFPDSDDWNFGGGDFTMEAFIRMDDVSGSFDIFDQAGGGSNDGPWMDWLFSSGNLRMGTGNTVRVQKAWSPSIDTVYHVACTRVGNVYELWVDGTSLGTNTDATAHQNANVPFKIGGDRVGFFDGWFGPVRITKGVGRYTSPFTPPTSFFPLGPTIGRRGLNVINGHALGGVPAQANGLVPSWTAAENRQPLAGSLLWPINFLSTLVPSVRLQIKAGDGLLVKYDKVIYDEKIHRLPTGFKSDLWQVNMYGNAYVYSVQIGTTPRSLKEV